MTTVLESQGKISGRIVYQMAMGYHIPRYYIYLACYSQSDTLLLQLRENKMEHVSFFIRAKITSQINGLKSG